MRSKGQASTPRFLTTDEVAALIRRRPATLRAWRATHQGPPWVKLEGTGTVLYDAAELDAWLERGRVVPDLGARVQEAGVRI